MRCPPLAGRALAGNGGCEKTDRVDGAHGRPSALAWPAVSRLPTLDSEVIRLCVKVILRRGFRYTRRNTMVVDFALKRAPKYRVASVRFVGTYQEKRIRSEWEGLAKWAKSKGLRTGKWFFSEDGMGPRYR